MLFIFFLFRILLFVLFEVCLKIIDFVPVQNKYNSFVGIEVLLILNSMVTKTWHAYRLQVKETASKCEGAANLLTKQSQTAESKCSSRLGLGKWLATYCKKLTCDEMIHKGLRLGHIILRKTV